MTRPLTALLRAVRHLLALALVLGAGLAPLSQARGEAQADAIDRIELDERRDTARALGEIGQLLKAAPPPAAADMVYLLLLRGTVEGEAGQTDAVARTAAALQALGSRTAHAAALLTRSQFEAHGGSLARALELSTEAAGLLDAGDDPRLHYRLALALGWQQFELGRLPQSLDHFQQALQRAEALGNPRRVLRVHDSLATVLAQAGEAERALKASDTALAMARQAGDPLSLAIVWGTRAVVLSTSATPQAAMAATEQSLRHARAAGSAYLAATAELNLGDAYLRAGRYADALAVSLQARDSATAIKDEVAVAIAGANAGFAEIRMGRLEAGKARVGDALQRTERMSARSQLGALLEEFGAHLEAAGDYKAALAVYHRGRTLNDEILNVGQKRALLELETRYQAEQRNREIELLNRSNALQAAELAHRSAQQRLWWLAAALAGGGLLAMGALMARVRQANRQLAESNALLKTRSERDPLTHLLNRRHFQDVMAAHEAGTPFEGTLFLIDIDHFKRINDSHGHAAGDAVIRTFAQRLSGATRDTDMAIRWGGEEFLVASPAMPPEQAERFAARLLQTMAARPIQAGSEAIAITVSIGLAVFPLPGAGATVGWEQAVRLADLALYAAKHGGRHRAVAITRLEARTAEDLRAIESDFDAARRAQRVTLSTLAAPPASA